MIEVMLFIFGCVVSCFTGVMCGFGLGYAHGIHSVGIIMRGILEKVADSEEEEYI